MRLCDLAKNQSKNTREILRKHTINKTLFKWLPIPREGWMT